MWIMTISPTTIIYQVVASIAPFTCRPLNSSCTAQNKISARGRNNARSAQLLHHRTVRAIHRQRRVINKIGGNGRRRPQDDQTVVLGRRIEPGRLSSKHNRAAVGTSGDRTRGRGARNRRDCATVVHRRAAMAVEISRGHCKRPKTSPSLSVPRLPNRSKKAAHTSCTKSASNRQPAFSVAGGMVRNYRAGDS
jgi:hypothetical protein